MKVLIVEGDRIFRKNLSRFLACKAHNVTAVGSIYDAIYYLYSSDLEFDTVIIGDELETSIDTTSLEELKEQLDSLEGCKYFPVEFGKVCVNLCKMVEKKSPQIVIYTTLYYYKIIATVDTNIKAYIEQLTESAGMKLIVKDGHKVNEELLNAIE